MRIPSQLGFLLLGKKLSLRAMRWLSRSPLSENQITLFLALLIGLSTGFVAVGFQQLMHFSQILFNNYASRGLEYIHAYMILFLPCIGGLWAGIIIHYGSRDAKGHGVAEVMTAVAIAGGRIPMRVGVVKALASALTIGSGGSAGAEGPIVQIGSSVGSSIGQLFQMSEAKLKLLVGCGVAAGISAIFNAPVAGVLFALEVILGEFTTRVFSALVLSSVLATVVSRAFFGNVPLLRVPSYGLIAVRELVLYLGLGLLIGVVAYAFHELLHRTESVFEKLRQVRDPYKPALGGLLVGMVGMVVPLALGGSFEPISRALYGEFEIGLLLSLILGKMLLTSLTLGSGGSGGVFSPCIFIGAMLGAAYGQVAGLLFPGLTAAAGAYAVVGMTACVAAAAQAPITAIIMGFELTNDYRIMLPLMFGCVIATLVFNAFCKESIYTFKLKKRGIHVEGGRDQDIMRNLPIELAMNRQVLTVYDDTPIADFVEQVQRSGHPTVPVLDRRDRLVGIISVHDVKLFRDATATEALCVRNLMTSDHVETVFPDEKFSAALSSMSRRDLGRLPVVSRRDPKRMVGIVSRGDILRAYDQELVRRHLA